jgi:hypothetical protein
VRLYNGGSADVYRRDEFLTAGQATPLRGLPQFPNRIIL